VHAIAAAVGGTVGGVVAAVSSRLRGAREPDAIEILEREHRRFEQLLKQGEETTDRARTTRRELLATLTAELNAHELMEEKVLHPALQSHPQARAIVLEGYQEHHVADLIVKELHDVATNDEAWGGEVQGAEGEHRAPHRGGGRGDVPHGAQHLLARGVA
jgi:hypothetical protein